MIKLFSDKEQKETAMTSFSDPFKSDRLEKIQLTIEKSIWSGGKIVYKGCLRFCSGGTTGYQDIKAESFPELVDKTEQFIKSLEER